MTTVHELIRSLKNWNQPVHILISFEQHPSTPSLIQVKSMTFKWSLKWNLLVSFLTELFFSVGGKMFICPLVLFAVDFFQFLPLLTRGCLKDMHPICSAVWTSCGQKWSHLSLLPHLQLCLSEPLLGLYVNCCGDLLLFACLPFFFFFLKSISVRRAVCIIADV